MRWIWRCCAWICTFSVQTSWNLRITQKFVETCLKLHVPQNCATNEDPGIYIYKVCVLIASKKH
jgi:hypothetical protein